jgi:hypothetical protein
MYPWPACSDSPPWMQGACANQAMINPSTTSTHNASRRACPLQARMHAHMARSSKVETMWNETGSSESECMPRRHADTHALAQKRRRDAIAARLWRHGPVYRRRRCARCGGCAVRHKALLASNLRMPSPTMSAASCAFCSSWQASACEQRM